MFSDDELARMRQDITSGDHWDGASALALIDEVRRLRAVADAAAALSRSPGPQCWKALDEALRATGLR